MRRRSVLGRERSSRLPEAVSRAMRQAGFVAPLAHLGPEPCVRERPAILGQDEQQLASRSGFQLCGKRRQDRDRRGYGARTLGPFLRHEREPPIQHVLPAETDHIGSSSASVDHQLEG